MKPPDNLPPLPPVPDGFDRWEYRGTDWQTDRQATYSAFEAADHKYGWHPALTFETGVYGSPDFHYIEAVRDAPDNLEEPGRTGVDLTDEDHAAIMESVGAAFDEAMMQPTGDPSEWTPNPDNLEGPGRTPEQMAEERRELNRIAPTPADKFRLMFDATGVEARVCKDIAARQRLGIAKYGVTVEQSTDDMLQHAYEEALDLAVYLKADIERTGWQPIETAPRDGTRILLHGPGPSRQVIGLWDTENQIWLAPIKFPWIPTHWMPLPQPPAERSDHE